MLAHRKLVLGKLKTVKVASARSVDINTTLHRSSSILNAGSVAITRFAACVIMTS